MARATGLMHPTDGIIVPPDTVTTFLMTGGSSQQNADWLSSGSTAAANAGTAGVHIVCITPMTTAGAALIASVNLLQAAATPASGTSIASTGVNHLINGPTYFQVPGGSTGFGFFTYSSGFVQMQQWRK